MPGRTPVQTDRLRVGLIAGEASGDLLGAGLVREIRNFYPDAIFVGVAGPAMLDAGVEGWLPMERLSVMGIAEIARHIPELLRIRRAVTEHFMAVRPDVVIGIDSPDFTLGVERRLRAAGIRTVHYVSPSIWAWRAGRIRTVAQAAELVLCLLPFEKALYDEHGIAAEFVGHPMADEIPMVPDPGRARAALSLVDLGGASEIVALLPGSRLGEVERLGGEFAAAAALMATRHPGLRFVAAMASRPIRECFESQLTARGSGVYVRLFDGRAREVMEAADIVMLASGTATLEAALLKRPMVVAYKVSELTRRIVAGLRLMKTSRFALPNLLAGEYLVPELIQESATAELIAEEAVALLDDATRRTRLASRFEEIHMTLRQGADRRAAEAVLRLVVHLPGDRP